MVQGYQFKRGGKYQIINIICMIQGYQFKRGGEYQIINIICMIQGYQFKRGGICQIINIICMVQGYQFKRGGKYKIINIIFMVQGYQFKRGGIYLYISIFLHLPVSSSPFLSPFQQGGEPGYGPPYGRKTLFCATETPERTPPQQSVCGLLTPVKRNHEI